jgi:peptide/nickel transport system permease protein
MRLNWSPRPLFLVLLLSAAVVLVVLSASAWAPRTEALMSPRWPHVLGTDRLGRDVLTITLAGAARSLAWASIVLAGAATIGITLGLVSVNHWKRLTDEMIQTLADSIRSFPSVVAALLFLSVRVPLPLVLIAYFWIPIWRVTRTQVGAQRTRPYVLNAILFGSTRLTALARHALPNATRGIWGVMFVVFAEIVSVQAGLEFLGFAAPMSQPTLGNIVSEAIRLGLSFAWTWLPAAVIAAAIPIGLFVASQRSACRHPQGLE